MFATCLFCNGPLGRNEAIENFPVGRRLAFDQSRGRLWVVCPKCERWNLSPLEERWEAIEEAERAFRDTKKRITTDNIGLARVGDGVDLVRIGSPLRAEFASWRYGDQFGRRRRKYIAYGAMGAAIPIGIVLAGPIGAGIMAGGTGGLINVFNVANIARLRLWTAAAIRNPDGSIFRLAHMDLAAATITAFGSNNELRLNFTHRDWQPASALLSRIGIKQVPRTQGVDAELRGEDVFRALATLLPVTNGAGGKKSNVDDAVRLVEDGATYTRLVARTRDENVKLGRIHTPLRLALEMSLHEADEQRALEGDLRELEQRWHDAEEIAAIADSLTLPADMSKEFERLKRRSDDGELK